MQLIDALEERSDSVKIIASPESVEVDFTESEWQVIINDGDRLGITDDALGSLLNFLKIPIKYIQRCTEEEDDFGVDVAIRSVNYWLSKAPAVSFLSWDSVITQVFAGKKLYIPGTKVNDLIFDFFSKAGREVEVFSYFTNADIFEAVYLTDEVYEVGSDTFRLGVRVMYSDCFTITPRFDGVLISEDNALIAFPVQRRKFRVAGSNIPLVMDQIEEFLDLSIHGLREDLIPAMANLFAGGGVVSVPKTVDRLCADLRVSLRIKNEILGWFDMSLGYEFTETDLIKTITSRTSSLGSDSSINMELSRRIQVALTSYIMTQSFK